MSFPAFFFFFLQFRQINKNAVVGGLVSPPLVLSVRHNSTAGCGNCHIHLYTGIML